MLFTGGFAALWEKVKDDLSNLKAMVIDAIQDWLITTIIKKAVAKIAMMFNPVGAIIQAILAIVDVVMFVVEKASQILEFISAVVVPSPPSPWAKSRVQPIRSRSLWLT